MDAESLERLSMDAAVQVSKLLPGSHVDDDGAGAFVSIPVKCSDAAAHIIAFLPLLDEGPEAKWQIQHNDRNWSWGSETLAASSPGDDVANWVREICSKVATNINAEAGGQSERA